MTDIKNQEHIDELRRRLYERNGTAEKLERHSLTPREIEVSRGWGGVTSPRPSTEIQAPKLVSTPDPVSTTPPEDVSLPVTPKPRRRYRFFIVVVSLVLFLCATALSSVYLFFGGNQISADNIALTMNVPESVAGGEVTEILVGIANQNSVTIESPVLIINYPPGTRSNEPGNRELYESRIPIDQIEPAQARNVPVRAIFYGEEGQEKEVRLAIEYRVKGSSGAFYKEIEPKKFTISSAPVAVRVSGVESISSGQSLELTITIESNSDTPQRNVLVSALYPESFSFDSADPEPSYGENSWLIPELPARGTETITIEGLVTGLSSEVAVVEVEVGSPQLNNQFLMGSTLSQSSFSFKVDQPFTGVGITVNGDGDGEAVVPAGDEAVVMIRVENSLEAPLRSVRIVAKPNGNLIRDDKLVVSEGYYDASGQVIRFDEENTPNLSVVNPGEAREFSFTVKPDAGQTTASFATAVEVYAKRGEETAESLIGTASTEAKYSATPVLGSQITYGTGPFTDTGAIPPVEGTKTTYTITLVAEAGVNDITSAVVTATLPKYMSWLDMVKGDGTVSYDAEKKQLKWVVGDVSAQARKSVDLQLEFLPTASQVGRTAVVIGAQELRATDRFTGVTVRATTRDLSNELSTELGFVRDNGIVRERE